MGYAVCWKTLSIIVKWSDVLWKKKIVWAKNDFELDVFFCLLNVMRHQMICDEVIQVADRFAFLIKNFQYIHDFNFFYTKLTHSTLKCTRTRSITSKGYFVSSIWTVNHLWFKVLPITSYDDLTCSIYATSANPYVKFMLTAAPSAATSTKTTDSTDRNRRKWGGREHKNEYLISITIVITMMLHSCLRLPPALMEHEMIHDRRLPPAARCRSRFDRPPARGWSKKTGRLQLVLEIIVTSTARWWAEFSVLPSHPTIRVRMMC